MTRSVLNFIFSGGSTDELMASTNALRIVCEKTFADCEWTINVDVSRQGSTLTVAVDGATFENVRALSEQYTTHLRTTTFKYAEPSFQLANKAVASPLLEALVSEPIACIKP